MSLDQRELSYFANVARFVVKLIDASTITIGQVPVGLTLAQLRTLVNRYYNETPAPSVGSGGSSSNKGKHGGDDV